MYLNVKNSPRVVKGTCIVPWRVPVGEKGGEGVGGWGCGGFTCYALPVPGVP